MFDEDKLIAFVDGFVTDEETLTDEMFHDASLHNPNGAWQLIFDGIFVKFDTALKLNETLGFWGLVILVGWQQIGYMMIVYIAGLQAIPGDIQEAAMIDGATII